MTASISDLLMITISIPPREIERLLDALANLPYPINPELKYEEWQTHVTFPAYRSWLEELRAMVRGFKSASLRISPAFEIASTAN